MQEARFQYNNTPIQLFVHDRDYISNVVRFGNNFFEVEILDYILKTFPNQQTIVDVGANIGNHARFFQTFLKPSRLLCFEPFPPNFQLLERNLTKGVELFPIGLGDHDRVCGMRYNEENLGIAILDDAIPGNIEVRTLDSIALENLTLLKIDVEGDDVAVLRGARNSISKWHPTIVVEGDYEKLAPELSPYGYVCVALWKVYNTYCFVRLAKGSVSVD